MSLKEIYKNKWFRLSFWAILYTLWVIWLDNYWWLLGLIFIYDHYITKKLSFIGQKWREQKKKSSLLEWLDALIFAVIVVTFINIFFFRAFEVPSSSMESTLYTGDHLFVSKLTYGPRIPETPLTIPFTHNVFLGHESYSTLIQNKYRRLKGFRDVRVGDIVVFNFPHGDSVLTKRPAEDYYSFERVYGRNYTISNYGPVIVRPYDKADHYVKRCVAIAGDTLEIKNARVYINSKAETVWPGVQNTYKVKTNGNPIDPQVIDQMDLNLSELYYDEADSLYPDLALNRANLERVKALPNVKSVEENIDVYPPDYPDSYLLLFPYDKSYKWTRDNYGPIWIPKKGVTVKLTPKNLPLYRRIIEVYEHNKLELSPSGDIYINGEKLDSYTFKQNYYFMMGDNRHNSLDSRYWGFVPMSHIVGTPLIIWLSIDKNRDFPHNIRWNRFLKTV